MFCIKCGSEIQDGALFCAKCGTKISNDQTADTPTSVNISDAPTNSNYNVNTANNTPQMPKQKKSHTWLVIVVILIIALGIFAVIKATSKKNDGTSRQNTTSTYKTKEAPTTTEAPNPVDVNDFSNIFCYDFSNTKEQFQNTVINNGYTELPTINHDYAYSPVSEDLLSQAASILLDSDRKSYYLDFTALGGIESVVVRYNTTEDLSKEVERLYGPSQNGEYLGHIGDQPVSLIVYQKELMGIVNWEISLSINHQK